MALITADKITVFYDRHEAVREVSVSVNAGDYLCIVGENGSGKSTLLKALAGLVRPSMGGVTLGEGLTRSQIGYLPQQTPVQRDFPASVYEVVLSGFQGRRGLRLFYTAAQRRQAREMLKRLDLQGLERRCYRELSGGQQQRVLLCRALCAAGRALLLDEPAAGLDPGYVKELYALLDALHAQGVAVVLVTHDLPAALNPARRVLQLDKRVVFYGSGAVYAKSDAYRRLAGGKDHA